MNNVKSDVLEAVKALPGVTRGELVDLLKPDHSKMSVGMAITSLARQGKLKVTEKPSPKKRGRRVVQAFEPQTTPPKKATVPEYHALQAEVRELRAWKADAIKRFPDLAVAPVILEARKIVAGETEGQLREDVIAGRKDGCPIMRAVVKALEAAR